MSFIAAYMPAGQTQYVSYTTNVAKAALNNNPTQTQAANDSGGTFTTNATAITLIRSRPKRRPASIPQ